MAPVPSVPFQGGRWGALGLGSTLASVQCGLSSVFPAGMVGGAVIRALCVLTAEIPDTMTRARPAATAAALGAKPRSDSELNPKTSAPFKECVGHRGRPDAPLVGAEGGKRWVLQEHKGADRPVVCVCGGGAREGSWAHLYTRCYD